jgi:hypothetical protein
LSLKNNKLPPLSLANKLFLGRVPDELKNLTVIEEAMIACCRSKCWIIQLREENQDLVLASTQHGIKGHIITYPQQPSKIADILPPSVEEITSPHLHLHQNGSGTMLNHLLWMRTMCELPCEIPMLLTPSVPSTPVVKRTRDVDDAFDDLSPFKKWRAN